VTALIRHVLLHRRANYFETTTLNVLDGCHLGDGGVPARNQVDSVGTTGIYTVILQRDGLVLSYFKSVWTVCLLSAEL